MLRPVATLRLFAQARHVAGVSHDVIDATTVAGLLSEATRRYGPGFVELLPTCRIWVDGESAGPDTVIGPSNEVAILPPVSGGSG
jgi:molybdopterin converting factor small subunit